MTQANSRANPGRPLDRVLDRLDGVKPQNGYFMARCPAHDDREPSLSVKEGDDGRVLLHCFTGCPVENIVAALDLSIEDLFESRNGYRRGGGFYPSEDGETVKPGGCTRADYAAAKKLPEKFL